MIFNLSIVLYCYLVQYIYSKVLVYRKFIAILIIICKLLFVYSQIHTYIIYMYVKVVYLITTNLVQNVQKKKRRDV